MRLFISTLLLCIVFGRAESGDNTIYRLFENAEKFSINYPCEKVYLHLDNTSYYYGDDIWFKAYVVNGSNNLAGEISNTLYVELLNPGGEIIDRKILKIEKGAAHGDFTINRVPFYSGFYEIRAYTKYMLDFGDDAIFSRVIPIFEKPKIEGDFSSKKMMKYGTGKFTYLRPKPHKQNKLNIKFYPEGGHMVTGIQSQVAFEATDRYGHPIDVKGTLVDATGTPVARFATSHEGKGSFSLIPAAGIQAIVEYDGKSHDFSFPTPDSSGYAMSVDNLSSNDSIFITIDHRAVSLPDTIGIAVMASGSLQNSYAIASRQNNPIRFAVGKQALPAGVIQLVLFGKSGRTICDRLIFNLDRSTSLLDIATKADKTYYPPYGQVNISVSAKYTDGTPVTSAFSISIREKDNSVEYSRDILTDLLLMSEIKGYVANPQYYFEADDSVRRRHLDLLLLVQGWRKHTWEAINGSLPWEMKYPTEANGIITSGKVTSIAKRTPKPDVDVSAILIRRNESSGLNTDMIDIFHTDSLGRFSFQSDVKGEWNLILSVREKGKKKNYQISLDRLFSPKPKSYRFTDMEINISDTAVDAVHKDTIDNDNNLENLADFTTAFNDSLMSNGVRAKQIHNLKEVVVKGKKRSKARDIYKARSKSLAYYDVKSGLDDIRDEGEYIGNDIHAFMRNMNRHFTRTLSNGEEYLLYKGRIPLFVINYTPTYRTKIEYDKYKYIRLEAIKSIYVSEDIGSMLRYADPMITPIDIDKIYGCVVFIETYPDGEIPVDAGKGVRKTRLEGYTTAREFYSPDYSMLEPESDYRRTLYWNPDVLPDENGEAVIRFYNNALTKSFDIDLQTITPDGKIGVSQPNIP